ncbi:hypothetical protein ACPA54_33295 [Uniformispora flossi]|uniref:hypothetical protein n=1 Tax=Uniformispora flossi TaxID=3390723 RepID=UPI003C2E7B68
MAATMLDLGIRIYLAMPTTQPLPADDWYKDPGGDDAPDTTTPLSPSRNVSIGGDFMKKLHDMLGWVQLGAWTVVMLGLIGCGGMMAWSWVSGKGFQALGRVGWVVGGAVLIGSATSIIDAFS